MSAKCIYVFRAYLRKKNSEFFPILYQVTGSYYRGGVWAVATKSLNKTQYVLPLKC